MPLLPNDVYEHPLHMLAKSNYANMFTETKKTSVTLSPDLQVAGAHESPQEGGCRSPRVIDTLLSSCDVAAEDDTLLSSCNVVAGDDTLLTSWGGGVDPNVGGTSPLQGKQVPLEPSQLMVHRVNNRDSQRDSQPETGTGRERERERT